MSRPRADVEVRGGSLRDEGGREEVDDRLLLGRPRRLRTKPLRGTGRSTLYEILRLSMRG
ncbi:MAG: hypothetical protein MPN21_07170 [Thermoanaerobaculia bacterium]|nr:hypothetical protein [Thermoanaerobaculia bacterium]